MDEKITRTQAWCKLAVLIADGLPAPVRVGFNSGTDIQVRHEAIEAVEVWATATSIELRPPFSSEGETVYCARGDWHGWSLFISASAPAVSAPEEITEDLTKVREVADEPAVLTEERLADIEADTADQHGPVDGCEDCEDLADAS